LYVAVQAHCGTPQWRGSGRGEIGAYVAPVVRSCCSILLLAIAAKAASLSLQFTTELGALHGILVGTFGY
jgi:hypothetical protein